MGKSENPVDIHRKAERKKEINKNKKQRLQSRNAKVIETRRLNSIQTEITSLESQKSQDTTATRKLERLKKELKLVQNAEEEKKKNSKGLIVPDRNETFDYDVRISYYYDPVYNPYGVAPPGKQILYHSKDGGVTKNRRHGVVPDKYLTEEEKLASNSMEQDMEEETGEQKDEDVPPPPPKENPPPEPLPIQETSKAVPVPITKVNLNAKPPPPSSSVQRLLKSKNKNIKLQYDIWASNDEIQINSNLEGTAPKSASSATIEQPDVWYYIDNNNQVQGPYSNDIMKSWYTNGFFPNTTFVKRMNDEEYKPIGSITYFQKVLKSNNKWKLKDGHTEEKEEEDIIQSRIDALKNDIQGLEKSVQNNEHTLPPPPAPLPPPPMPLPPQPNTSLMSDIPAYPIDDVDKIPSYPIPQDEQEEQKPKLKAYEGDKDVISFVPHNLRKKR